MPEEYKGFKIFNTKFQHLLLSTAGVQIEYDNGDIEAPIDGAADSSKTPTGRLFIDGTFAGFYPNSRYGVKAMLEESCRCLTDESLNHCGWSLDTDLYTRLNALDGTDVYWQPFKEKNPCLWTSSTQTYTDGDGISHPSPKSVRLVPCSYVHAMFFKNSVTGYKLMIALNYVGMHSYYSAYTSSGGYNDAGWLYNHVHSGQRIDPGGSYDRSAWCRIGGFMASMIPPANTGETQDDWHPEWSIRSENFYPPTMFPIVCQFASNNYYSAYYNNGSSSSSYPRPVYAAASLVRVGSGDSWCENVDGSSITNYNNKGCMPGTKSKISILADTKGNICISSFHKYTYTSNPMLFIGPIFKKKLYDYDELPQRYLCAFGYSCAVNWDYRTDSPTSTSYVYGGQCAWWSNSTGNSNLFETNISTANPATDPVYAAYPALTHTVYTNYRYSKACYTPIGLLDEDVIRCSLTDGLIRGQTFNNGDWCYITGIQVQTGTTSSQYLYMSIRWDKESNGNETFIDF